MKPRGCMVGLGVVVVLLLILGGAGYFGAKSYFEKKVAEFKEQGYQVEGSFDDLVAGKTITVDKKVEERTIYVARHIRLNQGSDRGLAFVGATVEIKGHVVGNVNFFGERLTIHKGAVLDEDLIISYAAILNNYGTVKGKTQGFEGAVNTTPPPNYYDK